MALIASEYIVVGACMCVGDGNLKIPPQSAVLAVCSMWMTPVLSKRGSSVSIGTGHLQRFPAKKDLQNIYYTLYTEAHNSP